MKQGPSTSKVGNMKREPIPHIVSPAVVSELGAHQVRREPGPEMFPGKGFKAPAPTACTTHPKGSQGRR